MLAKNSDSLSLCVKYKQPNVPQSWATCNALPPRPCAVQDLTSPTSLCLQRLAVPHGPVTEVCVAHFLVVSVPLCQPTRVSGSQGHRVLHKDKAQNTRGVGRPKYRGTTQGKAGRGVPEAERLTETGPERGLTPTGPQLVTLHGSVGTCQGPPQLTSGLDLGVQRLEFRGQGA